MELSNDLLALQQLVKELLSKIATLEAENANLRYRLGLNSNNSHKPPSSEGYTKKAALPKNKGKKAGGQKGHPGKTLQMVACPDSVLVHHARSCSCCGKTLTCSDVIGILEKRQVFDMPAPRLEISEHQLGVSYCCGLRHLGSFPCQVQAPVQYGKRILALSSVLNNDYRLPFGKVSLLFSDLFGYAFNPATVIAANERLYGQLAPIETHIKACLLASKVVHFDETGMRVAGKLAWFHTACNDLFTYLFVHQKRGKQALADELSLLKDFTHWAIHDCWASYFGFAQCQHALCNAHLVRELVAVSEQGSKWATQMHDLLLELYQESEKGTKILADKAHWLTQYRLICQIADKQEVPTEKKARGKPKNSKGRNLLNRLLIHQEAVLAFAFVEKVPFTNNLAEQAIRPVKIKQKVAMCLRTFRGAQVYARIQGFISTIRKQGRNILQSVIDVYEGKNIIFATT